MSTEIYYPPPFFENQNSRYEVFPTLGTKCPYGIFFGSYKHNCMLRDLFMVVTMFYRTFSNNNELCTKDHLLSFFFSRKGVVMFSDS